MAKGTVELNKYFTTLQTSILSFKNIFMISVYKYCVLLKRLVQEIHFFSFFFEISLTFVILDTIGWCQKQQRFILSTVK